jgi:hypothetical protein
MQLPLVIITCKVFEEVLEAQVPPDVDYKIEYLEYGLHMIPKQLKVAVQEAVDRVEEPSLIVLGYGLCGNGLNEIQAGIHTLLIARTDDCIAILMGSKETYLREFHANPGTYYLTKGWLEAGSDPLREFHNMVEKYGEEKAHWIMDLQYKNYKRLLYLAYSEEEMAEYRHRALEVAAYCERWGMRYEEMLGTPDYLQRLIQSAVLISRSGGTHQPPPDFIVVPPGGMLQMVDFIRLVEDDTMSTPASG